MGQSAYKENTGGGLGNDTVTLTALEDVQQGDSIAVATTNTGEEAVKAAFFRRPHSGAPSDLQTGFEEVLDVIEINTDKYVLMYITASGSLANFVICEVDRDTMTVTFGGKNGVGSEILSHGICKLDTDKFLITETADGDNEAECKVVTVSGTSISNQTINTLSAQPEYSSSTCCQLDTDKFGFFYTSSTGGASDYFIGFATVSGGTVTVVDSEESAGNIPNVTSSDYTASTKIATDKFVVTNGEGYGVVADTSSSTLTLGSELEIDTSNPNAPSANFTQVISPTTDAFYARFNSFLGYCTVSGTTITLEDSVGLAGDNGGDLVTDGTDVYEIFNSSSQDNGLYKVEFSGGSISRTAYYRSDMKANTKGFWGSNFFIFMDNEGTHIQGCSSEFLGFSTSNASAGTTLTVDKEKSTNQSGLIPGALYEPSQGGLSHTMDNTKRYLTKAVSDTRADVL